MYGFDSIVKPQGTWRRRCCWVSRLHETEQ